jgi:hypothetical protein
MTSHLHSRNLWPFGIIAAFAVFVAGTAALIVLACSHRTDLVSRDYYEQELRFQGHIARLERTRRLQPAVAVAYDSSLRQIRVSLPPEHGRREARGRIQFYRPSAAGLDRVVKLELDADGIQVLDVKDLMRGSWKVQVSWSVDGQDYFIDQKVVIGS